jgi:hypothetical protein
LLPPFCADTPPPTLALRAPLPAILRQLFAAAFDDYAIIADFRLYASALLSHATLTPFSIFSLMIRRLITFSLRFTPPHAFRDASFQLSTFFAPLRH